MEQLTQLMARGWNIGIECKGKGRTYEMTYEATANKVSTDEMTKEELIDSMYNFVHAVGDTLEEVVDRLREQIDDREAKP